MKRIRNIALLLAVMVFGFSVSGQAISLTVGSGDYYVNVGDYDYLPYAYNAYPGGNQYGSLSFQTAMGDYGTWASMQPFGQVWRPFAAADWRPYTQGHWSYTQYGPTWVGYEPWAWAGYHYGNWVYSQQMGWVWIPGYEWHPGRVAWSQGYNSLGWMPMPPTGYDYSRGHLAYAGPQNQFTYYDDDFSIGIGFGGGNDYYYGGPYYDPRYRNMYYNNSFLNLAGLLWTFIDPNHFNNDNYADYYYGGDYARYLFDRRLIRISTRPIDRVFIERVVRQPIQVRQVRTNEIQVDGRKVRLVAIDGEQERIRKHANTTVREVLAPAFAEKGRAFKGEKARNRAAVKRALNIEKAQPRVETVTSEDIGRESRQKAQRREQARAQTRERKRQEVTQVEKQGRFKEKKGRVQQTETEDDRSRSTRTAPGRPADQQDNLRRNNDRPEVQEQENRRRNEKPEVEEQKDRRRNERPNVEEQEENLRRNNRPDQERRNRPEEDQENIRRNRPDVETQDNSNRRNRPNDEEDVRNRDREQQSTVRPETEEGVQRDNDNRRSKEEAEVSDNERNNREKAETKKKSNTKSKSKNQKEKDKKDQDDEKPPQE